MNAEKTKPDHVQRFVWLGIFAAAMGALEAIVVVYLRELYHPAGFQFPMTPVPHTMLLMEMLRESCTIVMLAAVSVAVQEFGEKFGIVLPVRDASLVCRQSERHPHGCREEKCPYYKKETTKDIFAESTHLSVTVCHT